MAAGGKPIDDLTAAASAAGHHHENRFAGLDSVFDERNEASDIGVVVAVEERRVTKVGLVLMRGHSGQRLQKG